MLFLLKNASLAGAFELFQGGLWSGIKCVLSGVLVGLAGVIAQPIEARDETWWKTWKNVSHVTWVCWVAKTQGARDGGVAGCFRGVGLGQGQTDPDCTATNQQNMWIENICAYCIILCIWSTGLLACYSITACFVLMCCPNVVCLFETHVQLWCLGIYCLMVSSENNHFMTLELIVVRRINCTGFDTARSFRGTLLLHHWTLYRSLPSRVETSLCAMQLGLHVMMSKILFDCRISTWTFQHLKDDIWLGLTGARSIYCSYYLIPYSSTDAIKTNKVIWHHRLHQKSVWCFVLFAPVDFVKAWCSCNSQGHLHGALTFYLQSFSWTCWIRISSSELSHSTFTVFFRIFLSAFRQHEDGNGTPTTGPGQSPRFGLRVDRLWRRLWRSTTLRRRTPFRKKPQRLDMKMKATGAQLRRDPEQNKLAESSSKINKVWN